MHQIIIRNGRKLLGRYQNGNYFVKIYDDGTKVRIQPDDTADFTPAFAENCDVKITDKCDGGCPFCYEGCTAEGKHGKLLDLSLWDSLHPFTELAINGNDLSHPELEAFLKLMRSKQVIVNMTVNQKHCERHFFKLASWTNQELIHGLGISLTKAHHTEFFNQVRKTFPNAVIHTIAGVTKPEDYERLYGLGLKILILGYKFRGRGQKFYKDNKMQIISNAYWIQDNLGKMIKEFDVISFDNLALEQLKIKESGILSEDEWDEFYMGDDGNYTFYIDLVKGEFAKNSISDERYPIEDLTIDDMFRKVKNQK